ncbi:ATP-dependent RNA helicase HrpA [Fibrobacter sp. UWH4]|uniref:ATP-dependent RNA helicase HrpA n=1 Tax=Fibrobacter sp. UWH4 TaxID=1896210 RepID=UPI0009112417|nr:ATP-dependent RNA helicase HrpA [Fibrobacter sp. UWH4]SHK51377.1 RNA helicase HrpA [Fibrobacter sp. UWH4]
MDLSSLKIEYPELPVVEHREEFFELLEKHQVVIVKADTGSGKSTQLPKFLLEWYSSKGEVRAHTSEREARPQNPFKIGVTEPRRLAAISIADRLREELKDETLVSTKIRFWEQGQSDAPIKVMTDGILLQEFRRDRLFRQYSAIVIDEAHERSLNIDILLGIFKTVLQARPEFKLIVASATLDAKLFEEFYDNSCVLEAEGRTYPVDVEYYFNSEFGIQNSELRDASGKGDSGLLDEARDAILDLETRHRDHLLCFLPTERDIQDLAGELAHELDSASFDIFPLYGRMSPDEQRRIFKHTGKTRVVLATNIAETSLTIPGIAYVVDTGMARISRYNAQSRIQGLPVEEISKASARQRTGRAGRVKPGVCIRLYSPEDFEKRDEFTEPEIRRSNLANVVLQLRSLGLELENFPFLQSPPHSAFRGAYKTLFELGALTADNSSGHVTKLGREMTRLPMDVALSAVLLRARESGVLQPALIVCSALSIQDPRVVPGEEPERTRIRQLHRKFAGHKSDFLTYICMWNAFCAEWDGKSWNKLRKFCDKFSFHFLRCREWIDLYEQFGRILDVKYENRVCPLDSFHADNLHIALLSGFLGGIARRDIENGCYRLVSGRETHVFPGSDLYGKSVEWLFSAEVRETSRIFLNKGAEIKPEWIMQVAEPFCTRRWYSPMWNQERGFVEAVEEVSFRGLVISRGHRVDYARVNPDECAEIFWREAVVLGQMARPFAFMTHNERVVEDLHALEARKRQFGLAPSEDALVDYYVRIAHSVNSIKTLKDYIKEHTDQFLKFDAKFWLDQNDFGVQNSEFRIESNKFGVKIPLTKTPKSEIRNPSLPGGSIEQFRVEGLDGSSRMVVGEMVFDATKEYDGITLELPYDLIPQLTPAKLALSIHQWREWMAESIIREMPKAAKKQLENRRTFIDDAFCDKLKANPHKSPLLLLYEVFAGMKQLDCDIPTVTPEKENHLRLHIKVFKAQKSSSTERSEGGVSYTSPKFSFELSPEWGSFNLFAAVRLVVVTFGIDFALDEMRFGWRLGESALMTPAESSFWQAFRKRVEVPAEPDTLITDRLNLLETGGLYADGFKTALKAWVLKSLAADNLDANRCVRFSGLEFSRGKKINDFKNLAVSSRSEDDEVRLALVRATYESALLGAEAFVTFWDILREFSVAMRQGGEHARDALGVITANHKSIGKIIALYTSDKETTLFERLCVLGEMIPGAPNLLRDKAPLKPELSVRTLREKFRPFLKARFMKDHELKKARDLLSKMERLSADEAEFPELYLQACAMLEDFEILKFKRKGDDSEEVIEDDALAKLKGRFGRL